MFSWIKNIFKKKPKKKPEPSPEQVAKIKENFLRQMAKRKKTRGSKTGITQGAFGNCKSTVIKMEV